MRNDSRTCGAWFGAKTKPTEGDSPRTVIDVGTQLASIATGRTEERPQAGVFGVKNAGIEMQGELESAKITHIPYSHIQRKRAPCHAVR